MSQPFERIELGVNIPGPKTACQPLAEVEQIFLEKFQKGLVTAMAEGRVWQGH